MPSYSLVKVANTEGYEAHHVAYLGLAGAKDWEILKRIIRQDYTFVTNNSTDFRNLYATERLHAGLIIIVPQVRPALQRELFRITLEQIGSEELINQVLEVDLKNDVALFLRYSMPRGE